jgi:hypothetical protein
MTNGTLPFSDTDYDKLKHPVFPTIRRRDKYGDIGDVNTVTHGESGNRDELGRALIVGKETVTIKTMPEALFLWDTESDTFEDAYESINKFYQTPIAMDEELTMYWNKWVNYE